MQRCLPIITGFVVFVIAGCSNIPWFGAGDKSVNEPAKLTTIVSQVKIERIWSKNIGNLGNKYETNLRPTIVDNKLYVANKKGEVSAIDINNGRIIWKIKLAHELSAGPVVKNDHIALGTLDGQALLLSSESGVLIWSAEVTSEVLSLPAIDSNRLIIRTNDGRVYGFDLASGDRVWVYDREMPILTIRGNSSPIVRAGVAVFGFDNGYMTALRTEDGAVLWEEPVVRPSGKSELERLVDIDGQMDIIATDIYAVSLNGRLVAMTLTSGNIQWTRDFSSTSGLTVARTNLFLSDEESHLWAIDRRSGVSLWQQDALKYRQLSTPTAINDLIVVGDIEGYLHALDQETGKIIGRFRAHKEAIVTSPIMVNHNQLVTFDMDGNLSLLAIKSN